MHVGITEQLYSEVYLCEMILHIVTLQYLSDFNPEKWSQVLYPTAFLILLAMTSNRDGH